MTNRESSMKMISMAVLALTSALVALPAAAQDAEAAQKFMKAENCTKCHSVDKAKKGPAFQKVAARYKGKADADAKLETFLTTGPKVKLEDGSEEEHKVVKDKGAVHNFVKWLLAL